MIDVDNYEGTIVFGYITEELNNLKLQFYNFLKFGKETKTRKLIIDI